MTNTSMLDQLVSVEELAPAILERHKTNLLSKEEWKLGDLSELNLPKEDFERIVFLVLSNIPMDKFSDFIQGTPYLKTDDISKLTSDIRKTFASYLTLTNDEVLGLLTDNERYKIISKFSLEILIDTFLFGGKDICDHKSFVTALKFIPDDYGLQSVLRRYADVKKKDFYEKETILKNTKVILTEYFSKLSLNEILQSAENCFESFKFEFIGDELLGSFIYVQSDSELNNRYQILKSELTSKWVHKDQVLGLFTDEAVNSGSIVIEDAEPIHNPDLLSVEKTQPIPNNDEPVKVNPVRREEIPVFTLNTETKRIVFEEKPVEPVVNETSVGQKNDIPEDDDNVPLFVRLQKAAQKKEEDEQKARSQNVVQTSIFETIETPPAETATEEKSEEKPFDLTSTEEAEITFDPAKKNEPKNPYPPLERLITQNQAKLFVKNLFNRDERRFVMIIKDLNDITSWEEGKKYIELIFTEFKVDLYSREAIQFTDIVYGRYHHL